MPFSKTALLIIALFLITTGAYLVFSHKEIHGGYYGEGGWTFNSLSGPFVLCLGLGFLGLLVFIIKRRKL
jgi:hypothetical protein